MLQQLSKISVTVVVAVNVVAIDVASKFAITDIREKPVNFICCSTQVSTLVTAITLLTQVLLQKFPFLFIFIIDCINTPH